MINPLKIKDVIGKGGEMITKIICEASNVTEVTNVNAVKVELEDDGRVIIYHSDKEIIDKTRKMIEEITREVEEGKIYNAKVVKVEDFGCFVEIWPGCEGLVHVSQLAHERVEKPSDVVAVGDEILVKALGADKRGRQNFSRKDALPKKVVRKNGKIICNNCMEHLQKQTWRLAEEPTVYAKAKKELEEKAKQLSKEKEEFMKEKGADKLLAKRFQNAFHAVLHLYNEMVITLDEAIPKGFIFRRNPFKIIPEKEIEDLENRAVDEILSIVERNFYYNFDSYLNNKTLEKLPIIPLKD